MKKLFLLFGFFAIFQLSYGQCDKKITFKCNKGRDYKNGTFGEDLPIEATITIDHNKVIFAASLNGDAETVEGEITEVAFCEWTEYLKNGKTQYKAYMRKQNEDAEKAIIEIESENGITKITCGSDPDTGSKLQLDVTEFTITEDESANIPNVEPVKNVKKAKKKSRTSQ